MKSVFINTLLNLILAITINTILVNAEWEGCVTEYGDNNNLVKSNVKTGVCLTVGENVKDWGTGVNYKRYSFAPRADDYSRFVVQGSYNSLVKSTTSSNTNVTVFASSQKSLSFVRKYYDADFGVFPYLTAVINVKKGVVQGIAWDDACVFCREARCLENTFDFSGNVAMPREPTRGCYLSIEECDRFAADATANSGTSGNSNENVCDLKLYAVWTGTDSDGNYLKSSSKRFSAFSTKQVQDQVRDGFAKLVPDFDFRNIF